MDDTNDQWRRVRMQCAFGHLTISDRQQQDDQRHADDAIDPRRTELRPPMSDFVSREPQPAVIIRRRTRTIASSLTDVTE